MPPAGERETAAKTSSRNSDWELFHLGLVVRDLDRTLEYLKSLGLLSAYNGFPDDYTPPRFEIPGIGGDALEPSAPSGEGRARVRQVRVGPLPIEVIQLPGGGRDANSEFLDSRGEGIAHMGFFVDDLEAETARLVEKGIQVLLIERREGYDALLRHS